MPGSTDPPDRPLGDLDELGGHLQAAARELIAAGRVLLDAAERLVDDPKAAGSVVALLASMASSATSSATARAQSTADSHREEGPRLQHIEVT